MKKTLDVKFVVLLTIAILLIVIGVARGDYIEILNKAKMICFECIGIG